ncbi:Est protein [Pasteurella multocida]|nr:Est protein [Pasteurella multocida]
MKINTLSFALFCSLSSAALAQDVVVFGDSLSDMGQTGWNKKASYLKADGSYHHLYDEYLAQAFGKKINTFYTRWFELRVQRWGDCWCA